MNHLSTPSGHDEYMRAISEEDARLEAALTALTASQDAGDVNPAEAAAKRITLLEAHLAACQQHRRRLLGGELCLDGCELIMRRALKDAITYRAARAGQQGQVQLFRIAGRRLFGMEL